MYLSNLLYLLGNLFPFYYLFKYSDIRFSYLLIITFALVFMNVVNNIYKAKTLNNIMFTLNILSVNIILFLNTSSDNLLNLIIIFIITLYSIYFSLTAKKRQIEIYYLFIITLIVMNYFIVNPKYLSVEFLLFTCTLASIFNIIIYIHNDIKLFTRKKTKKVKRKQINNDKIWQFKSFFISTITLYLSSCRKEEEDEQNRRITEKTKR